MYCGYNTQIDYIFILFYKLNLVLFQALCITSEWPGDTYWAQLLLQFYTDSFETSLVFGHDLKICMWFGYNPQIIFCHFFCKLNLAIFWALSITI